MNSKLRSIESKLKVNWKSIESKLKSIESKLKSLLKLINQKIVGGGKKSASYRVYWNCLGGPATLIRGTH